MSRETPAAGNEGQRPPAKVGDVYGRLTILEMLGYRPKPDGERESWVLVQCRCDAQTVKELRLASLRSGNTSSCGCIHSEKLSQRLTSHGEHKTQLYGVWASMKHRTTSTKTKAAHRYVGRGITVCPEWRDSFVVFRDWALVNGYMEGKELDRIDGDQGYGPDNCQWITKLENLNKRSKFLSEETEAWLRTYAAEVGRSPQEVIKRALEFYLDVDRTDLR
ncbi:hypothetical protein GCM10009839_34100 [Catenulispora yoronensis]|uniref:Uncharacterized protein n=1 Tax=Catenulispora yoronensis TaxID=450799 RepID=A0ABN2UAB8_9ACTN